MFARRFFPGTMFAPRYFPAPVFVPPPVTDTAARARIADSGFGADTFNSGQAICLLPGESRVNF
jgi:hypothetical protein